MDHVLEDLVQGAVAGAVATLPMSGVMYAAKQIGLMGEYPPRKIARKSMQRMGLRPPREVHGAAATMAHLGFGAATGVLYGFAHRRVGLPGPPVLHGAGYGLIVYAVSYSGWIPALRLMPKPKRDRPGRQPTMVVAHLVYGLVLGALTSRRFSESEMPSGRSSAPTAPAAPGTDRAELHPPSPAAGSGHQYP
jgi:hypothetical protein